MEISKRLFPYPVLSINNEDYVDSSFTAEAECRQDGDYFNFQVKMQLNNDELAALIEAGEAVFAVHVENPKTSFRKVYQSSRPKINFSIETSKLNGKVQLTSFITASCSLGDFSNGKFHPDYDGLSFEIEAGNILAYFPTIEIDIYKSSFDLKAQESIFAIVKNYDAEDRITKVEFETEQKIIIRLPLETYEKYSLLNYNPDLKDVLNSMVIFPTLVYVLNRIQMLPAEEREALNEYKWFRVLTRTFKDKMDTDILDWAGDEDNKSSFEMAQKLTAFSMDKALYYLAASEESGDRE